MYSDRITQIQIERAEERLGAKVIRHDPEKAVEIAAYIHALRLPNGSLARDLRAEEAAFISNERLRSQLDFRYWASTYCRIIKDGTEGGGIGRIRFWEAQEIVLRKISALEELCWEQFQAGENSDGICLALHKDRQLGLTALSRQLLVHRFSLWPYTRAMSASIDEDKVFELYDRDKIILDNLPWFLQPSAGLYEKAGHIHFTGMESRSLYQHAKQQTGLGQGRQFDVAHLTECAFFPYPAMIEFDFFPTLPQNWMTLCLLESTANGRGNWWHTWTEQVRQRRHHRWHYLFIPCYAEEKKYRRTPPEGWEPKPITKEYAEKVRLTSPTWIGRMVEPVGEHLYWYETERASALEAGTLNLFLSNYGPTPEDSFQHTTRAAFSTAFLEQARLRQRWGAPYEISAVR